MLMRLKGEKITANFIIDGLKVTVENVPSNHSLDDLNITIGTDKDGKYDGKRTAAVRDNIAHAIRKRTDRAFNACNYFGSDHVIRYEPIERDSFVKGTIPALSIDDIKTELEKMQSPPEHAPAPESATPLNSPVIATQI